jgi:hypothetical protein
LFGRLHAKLNGFHRRRLGLVPSLQQAEVRVWLSKTATPVFQWELVMVTETVSALCRIFDDWTSESRRLVLIGDQIRDWMVKLDRRGSSDFQAASSKLRHYRDWLEVQFEREDVLLATLATLYPASSPEVCAFNRQSQSDHQALIDRCDNLVMRLTGPIRGMDAKQPFSSWREALDEVDLFFAAVEQHELEESERTAMLIPAVCRNEES